MTELRLVKVDYEEKGEAKAEGARWNSELKCWYIPQGIDPMKLMQWWRYLECPFHEKDEVRRLGAKWDKHIKKWYVPKEQEFTDFEPWWPNWVTERINIKDTDGDDEVIDRKYFIKGQAGGFFCFWINPTYFKRGGTAGVYFGKRVEEFTDDDDQSAEGLEPTIAIKFFDNNPDDNSDNSDFTMFERELSALKKLSPHPNIVKLIDYGFDKTDNTFFIVTEYHSMALDDVLLSQFTKIELLHGELDLTIEHAEQREIEKNMPIEEIWLSEFDEVLAGILTGLIHAFDKGIMHRDLKPGNILISISEEGDKFRPLLIDFGIATLSENLGSNQATVGNTRTKLYSPEITDEEKEFPGARDVYSWGVIAIECISKEQIRTYTDLIRIFEDEIEPNFPQSIVKILGSCISLRAKKRPKDVKNLLKILQAANKKLGS